MGASWQAGAAGLVVMASAFGAAAAGLQVSPVRLQFEPNQPSQVLLLNNSGEQALNAQVRVLRWSQRDHQDVLDASDDIVASPAIVRVLPGQPQTIRVLRTQQISSALEQSFRILVDELPGSPTDGAQTQSGLQLLMRYSIPVFISPSVSGPNAKAQLAQTPSFDFSLLSAAAVLDASGQAFLELRNPGPLSLRISQVSVIQPDGAQQVLSEGLLGYVLPQQAMRWPLPQPLRAGAVLAAQFNDELAPRRLPLRDARP